MTLMSELNNLIPPGRNNLCFCEVSDVINSTKSLHESTSPAILKYLGVSLSIAASAVNSATLYVVVNSYFALVSSL